MASRPSKPEGPANDMKDCAIIGRHGFIGSALAARLDHPRSFPTAQTKVLFHFGSYTHPNFEQNPECMIQRDINEFNVWLPYCKRNGILFVYPSTALIYEKPTAFTRHKRSLELLAESYQTASIGLRIFPVYGPGESHTVISQSCNAMMRGERPIIYGDGTQTRDFIHVNDVAEHILICVQRLKYSGASVVDIGTGRSTSFNYIVRHINKVLGTDMQPRYIDAPDGYSSGIVCQHPLKNKTLSIEEGIDGVLKSNGLQMVDVTSMNDSKPVFLPAYVTR